MLNVKNNSKLISQREILIYFLGRQFVASVMFSYYDQNSDQQLDVAELNSAASKNNHLDKLSQHCHLEDMIQFDDLNRDKMLSLTEFYMALSKVLLGNDIFTIFC